jgi:hypothetical protein
MEIAVDILAQYIDQRAALTTTGQMSATGRDELV